MRSTLASEANGLTEGADTAWWLRCVHLELTTKHITPKRIEEHDNLKPVFWFTDSRSLTTALLKDAGRAACKRCRVLIAALRQELTSGVQVYWIDTVLMLADCLTKRCAPEVAEFLWDVIDSNMWNVTQPEEARARKAHAAQMRKDRRARARAHDLPNVIRPQR